MIRQALSFSTLLLLAGAVALATPSAGLAQHAGGGHAGGGHAGGGHAGGGHFGGSQFGGFHGGSFNGPAHFGNFQNLRPLYGFHPYYGFQPYYGYSPYYYGSYGYSYPYAYDSGYSGSYGGVIPDSVGGIPPAGNYQSLYPPATQADTIAHVTVRVPADARVWIQNTPTTSTGPVREFVSPPLTPGGQYTYDVRATWNENGHEVTQSQQVGIAAGASVEVVFPVKPGTTGQLPVPQTR
jgi:uncharacterized protein (TIGR03000 family)